MKKFDYSKYIGSYVKRFYLPFKEYDLDKGNFYKKLGINTCMIIDNETITYHCDIKIALRCLIENRDKTFWEWD